MSSALQRAVARYGFEYQSIGDTLVQWRSRCRHHNIVQVSGYVSTGTPQAVTGDPTIIPSKELDMSSAELRSEPEIETLHASTIDMKLEIVVIPVSDVERAKRFYGELGWRLDLDYTAREDFRVIQFTPPGSGCSVIFGKNVTAAAPGSVQGLHLVVSDIEAARTDLLRRGIEISGPFHDSGGVFHHAGAEGRLNGPNPQRKSYASYAAFTDPDGNGWLLQEITARLTGQIEAGDTRFTSELVNWLSR
jgi:catechol 2,3-dioxygenase-like lactoylglutathione lyase family enzyme